MSDYPTGGGFNYDFWSQYLDDEDTTTDTTTTDTTTTGTATDTNAVLQFIDDLFEDPTFIENLNQLTETQNWNPEEQGFENWANEDWDNYWSQLLSGDEGSGFDYDFWSDWLDLDDEDTTTTDTTTTDTTTEGETVDVFGVPLPNPEDYDEGHILDRDGYIYVLKDGVWQRGEEKDEDKDPTGIFGGTAGPKIKDWLKGIFGIPESFDEDDTWWQKLLKIYLGGKAAKEGLDVLKYDVPTKQSDAMSEYEKEHPLNIDMGLESLGPNYLEGQLYGKRIGEENVPAATHTLGFPYAEKIEEEVQGAQRGGIMNARSHGDIVPALLEPGEFVMNLQSVKGAGNGDARQGAKRMYKMMRQLERMG